MVEGEVRHFSEIELPRNVTTFQFTQWINTTAQLWTGLTDRQSEGAYVWESGRQLSADVAAHWKSDQPSDLNTQNCVYITGRDGKLGDARCSVEKRFVCQIR